MRGAVPVFVDIRLDTLNIDETLIEAAITPKTKAIVPVHYAGVACQMDVIMDIANRYGLMVVEDAAQGIMSTYKGQALGSIGHLGCLSFHETKNIISGEGGALMINDEKMKLRAEIIREKGTDRSRFFRGEVDKYTWQEIGSSFLPGELVAAFLWAQFEEADSITDRRLFLWSEYHTALKPLEDNGLLIRPTIPAGLQHNAHMYYVVINVRFDRQEVLSKLKEKGINALFHYVPLHLSPAGQQYGRVSSTMKVTNYRSEKLIRLPLWIGLTIEQQKEVVFMLEKALT